MIYQDFSNLTITWTKVATNPFNIGYPGSTQRPYACIVNGYFTMVYCCSSGGNPKTSRGFYAISFDVHGNYCIYQTADLNTAATDEYGCDNTLTQSGNTFQYSLLGGGTWKVVIPPIFTPGGKYILPPQQLNVTNPCRGGPPDQTIFLQNQGLIAYEWIQAFSESDNYWASIYDSFGNFKNGGFIGNSPQNLFNRIQISLPPYTFSDDVYYRNGSNIYGNYGNAGGSVQVYGFNTPYLFGNYGTLVCGGSGNPNVYVDAINQFQVYPNRDYGVPPFSAGSYQQRMGITDYPGYFIFPDGNNVFWLYSQDYLYRFQNIPYAYGGGNAICYLSKQNVLIGQASNVSGQFHYNGDIYVGTFPNVNIAPPPKVSASTHKGLANYHRAVSPHGLFQA